MHSYNASRAVDGGAGGASRVGVIYRQAETWRRAHENRVHTT